MTEDYFLKSREWRVVRMRAIDRYGNKCQCCGAGTDTGRRINVDHIKPRARFPELALDITNLQVLCEVCNQGKGNWLIRDFRRSPPVPRGIGSPEEETERRRQLAALAALRSVPPNNATE